VAIGALLLVIAFSQQFIVGYFEAQINREMRLRSAELADGLINGMNMLMVTGQISDPDNRKLLLKKMADSKGVSELRIIRAKQVQDQFGPGLPTEQARDDLDRKAIETKAPVYQTSELSDGSHQFRAVIPFIASRNFRGTNCLACHHVQEGSVNGAASIELDMDEADAKIGQVKRWVWAADLVFALILALVLIWRKADQRIQVLANYDTVTGLPNRNLLHDRLAQTISFSRRYQRSMGILFIDLDDFKNVNDSLGHHVGDQLLKELAARLKSCVREVDTVARLGGDEFVIVLMGVAYRDDVIFFAEKLLEAIARPFPLEGRELFVSTSIGIAVYPKDGEDEATLLKNADSAMYHAKERGKGNYSFYSADMNATALERLSLVNDLHRALERNEFILHYQPQISLKGGKITGVEALIRWQHPQHGLVAPAKFIRAAEETRLIVPIGQWVMRAACAQAVKWHEQGYAVTLAVNLSALQLDEHALVKMVDETLLATGINPRFLELELTETQLIQQPDAIYKIFEQLREKGVRMAIDDFGTGYSSLSYLKKLPIDKLKIDASFVRDIATDSNSLEIVQAIISMAHGLRLKALAEGVETQEQRELLHRLGCDELQGYVYSKPLSPDEVGALLAEQSYVAAAAPIAR
jgi:diguanylate cyclase (GGDEF)-like protein